MRSGDLLPHRRQKSLRVEEAVHPEHVRTTIQQPAGQLRVSVQQVGEPESDRRRLPRDLTDAEQNFHHTEILCSNYSPSVIYELTIIELLQREPIRLGTWSESLLSCDDADRH